MSCVHWVTAWLHRIIATIICLICYLDFFLDIVNMHYPHNASFLVSLFLFNFDYNLNYFVAFINLFQSCSTTYPRKKSAFCVGQSLKSVRIRSFSGSFFPVLGMSTDQKNSEYGHFYGSECWCSLFSQTFLVFNV